MRLLTVFVVIFTFHIGDSAVAQDGLSLGGEIELGLPSVDVEMEVQGAVEIPLVAVEVEAEIEAEVEVEVPAQTLTRRDESVEVAPRHQRAVPPISGSSQAHHPVLSIGLGIGLGAEKWALGEPRRDARAGPILFVHGRLSERDLLTFFTSTRHLFVGVENGEIPIGVGLLHDVAGGGNGSVYIGGDVRAFIDFAENRDVEIDWGGTARLAFARHVRAINMGLFVEFYGTLRVSFDHDALGVGGGMNAGFTADFY